MNKYHAKRTYSNAIGRWFASRKECYRATELGLMQKGGFITDLTFQEKFVLSENPKVTITIDFKYREPVLAPFFTYEDSKGVLTRDTRTKLAWLKEKEGIEVILS